MNLETLTSEYTKIKESVQFKAHSTFIKALLASTDPEAIAYHYTLLRERDNNDLYLRLRAAFTKRGESGEHYLLQRMEDETSPEMKADMLTMLGVMRSSAVLPLAREATSSDSADLRYRGCYVLGWMGKAEDIKRLGDRMLHDPDSMVRITAASAHSQFFEKSPRSKNKLLLNLQLALEQEEDEEVSGWIVVAVQYILKKRFGMKEDIEEAELKGNLDEAKEKCQRALKRLKLS